jgi:hypothetical protein
VEKVRKAYKVSVWKPEGKRQLGRPRSRWEDYIKMAIREEGWEWIHLPQDTDQWQLILNTVTNFRVPQKKMKFLD